MTTATKTPDLDALSPDDLRAMVIALLGKVAKLEAQVVALTEENARLKDLKGRPKLKASGMEKGTEPTAALAEGDDSKAPRRKKKRGQRDKAPKSARMIVSEERELPLAPEPGWRFKGYKLYTVQELVIEVRAIRYWRT